MQIAQEEIFGPVTCVLRWKDEEEMLRQVNDVDYGLAGGIWTRDLTRAHVMARRMETGIIWINKWYNFVPGVSGGGYKQSGFGREGGLVALEEYTHTKRSEEHTSELQSLMRTSYAVFCLKKKKHIR